jgi:hypothetical protein
MQERTLYDLLLPEVSANDKIGYTPEQLTCEERGVIYGAIL